MPTDNPGLEPRLLEYAQVRRVAAQAKTLLSLCFGGRNVISYDISD